MSQQLKFVDGTVLPITLTEGEDATYPYQGGKRDCIDFQLDVSADITLDALDNLTADAANTKKLVLITDEQDKAGNPLHTESALDNYSLRVEFGKVTRQTDPGNSTTAPTYEERVHVVLAQLTYAELQAAQLQSTVDALVLSSLEA